MQASHNAQVLPVYCIMHLGRDRNGVATAVLFHNMVYFATQCIAGQPAKVPAQKNLTGILPFPSFNRLPLHRIVRG